MSGEKMFSSLSVAGIFYFLDQGILYNWLAIFLWHQGSSDVLFGFTFLFYHYISPASFHYFFCIVFL